MKRMKVTKMILWLLIAIMVLALASCSAEENDNSNDGSVKGSVNEDEKKRM